MIKRNNILISIVVPVYNAESHLVRCLDSLIGQTFENFELIVINDGSTDSSLSIIKSYLKDQRIKLVDQQNSGLSYCRQLGLNIALGKYFCTIDADDYVEPSFLEFMYNKIVRTKADICVCGIKIESGTTTKIHGFESTEVKDITPELLSEHYSGLAKQYYMSDSWNKMYRITFINNTGIKYSLPDRYRGTDLLFNHLLLLHSPRIVGINQPLYNYIIYQSSRSHSVNKHLQPGFNYIISMLLREAEIIKMGIGVYKQISALYVEFLYLVIQSRYVNESNIHEKYMDTIDLMIQHSKYLSVHQKIKLILLGQKKVSLALFVAALKTKSSIIVSIYLTITHLLKKIIQKN